MVSILLSTFNGEAYIREQLDSLLNQTYDNLKIFIRDDGSTDSTVEILEQYSSLDERIVIYDNNQIRMGPCKSFMWLLERVNDQYYMFCDQDDIWFPNKIQLSIDALKCIEYKSPNAPIVVHTDLIVTDENLNIISNSYWIHEGLAVPKMGAKYLPFVNYITGCTMLFNNCARDAAIYAYDNALMHDFWLAICIHASGGEIVSLPVPTIYYRQHGKNTIGASLEKKQNNFFSRYLHIPNFRYSIELHKMISQKYKMSILRYLALRIRFYFIK